MDKGKILLLGIGFAGQILFFMRFFVQWLHTEKYQKSVIPESFWYFSIGGSLCLLIYALLKRDIVFTVGQTTGFFIYIRNIYFIKREKKIVK